MKWRYDSQLKVKEDMKSKQKKQNYGSTYKTVYNINVNDLNKS